MYFLRNNKYLLNLLTQAKIEMFFAKVTLPRLIYLNHTVSRAGNLYQGYLSWLCLDQRCNNFSWQGRSGVHFLQFIHINWFFSQNHQSNFHVKYSIQLHNLHDLQMEMNRGKNFYPIFLQFIHNHLNFVQGETTLIHFLQFIHNHISFVHTIIKPTFTNMTTCPSSSPIHDLWLELNKHKKLDSTQSADK